MVADRCPPLTKHMERLIGFLKITQAIGIKTFRQIQNCRIKLHPIFLEQSHYV